MAAPSRQWDSSFKDVQEIGEDKNSYKRLTQGLTKYGLILPKKTQQKTLVTKKPSVFADDSEEETSVGESLQKEALKKQVMKQTKLEIQKALAEDSTVYEYDSIYDEMQQQKKESDARVLSGKDDKKPRYIHSILKAAEIRKKEEEKRMDRKIQKEREMEGGEFDDKEAFVTSAYKKKLQERAEEEEREKKEAALEACLDVTKQKDLSGFYRHLLNQQVGEEEMPKCSLREARIKEEKSSSTSDAASQRNRIPEDGLQLKTTPKAKDKVHPDADTDLESESSDDDRKYKNTKVHSKKKESRDSSASSGEDPQHHRSRKHSTSSRSSSDEGGHHAKAQSNHPRREESGTGRRESDEQCRESNYERRGRGQEKDHQRKKEDQHRYGDHSSKDSYRKREEQEDKRRGRERKEREGYDRERRREKEREDKHAEREREKERLRNGRDGYSERERERGGKCREKEEPAKEKKDRDDKSEKKPRDRKESSPRAFERDSQPDPERERERDDEGASSSEKRRAEEGGLSEAKEQTEKPSDGVNKFAKRSSEETVTSARDRYLARQMARVSTKSYVEKEED